jgi:hypothetical protein
LQEKIQHRAGHCVFLRHWRGWLVWLTDRS